MADQLPGFVGDNAGDANTYLQQMFVNRRASPFGTSYKSMHEVGFNKRVQSAVNQPPADGHPTRMEFKVSSTLGHLLHNMYFRVRFVVTPKSQAELTAHIPDGTQDNFDGTSRPLSQLLENIKLHPDGLLGMIDNVEMRHNSIVFQRLRRENLRLQRREQYNKDDHELQTRLLNGGTPKYHWLEPYNQFDLPNDPALGDASASFHVDHFVMKSENHGDSDTYKNISAYNTATKGHDGMYDTTDYTNYPPGKDGYPQANRHPTWERPLKNQFQQLQKKIPDEPKHILWDQYKPEFCHEIGLKDLPSSILCSETAADKKGNDIVTALGYIREQGGWVFDMQFEVPHPWHYNTADAFPILNLVNDMDVIFHLRPWQQWIQNWEMVSGLVDIKMDPNHIDMMINYYDIPKAIWDDQFPLNRQMNHYAPDYQQHLHEMEVTVPMPTAAEIENAPYTKHRSLTTGKEESININTIDRVARYGMLRLQGTDAVRNGTHALEFQSWDLLSKAWLEVANEKLLTKIETDVDVSKKYVERSQHFKELKNYAPGEVYYFPLGLDCDIHNPGGGVVNIRPFYNNFKLRMVFDPVKIHNLYVSGIDGTAAGATHKTTGAANPLTTGTLSSSSSPLSAYQTATQSYKGYITKNTTANTYTVRVRASIDFLVLDLVTYQNGQLYKQS